MKTPPLQQFIRFVWISAVIAVFIHLINYMGSGLTVNYLTNYKYLLVNFSYAFIIGIFNITFITLIQSKFSWREEPKTLIVLGILGTVIVSVLGFFIARIVHSLWIYGYTFQYFLNNESLTSYIFAVLIAIIVSLAFHAYYFYKFGADAELKAQKEIVEHTKAKHKALQDQLDPHFLFNSLSVLASLIEEDPKRATEFTTSLSKVYRYVLDQRQEDVVSLSSELDFAKVYLNLLAMRFEDSLSYSINVTDETAFTIPLSLQLLIENAVKHNKVTERQPLHIEIFKTESFLVVQNNVNPKAQESNRNGIGLKNIKNRFEAFTEIPIQIEKDATKFRVKLPLIKNQYA
ncbi:sensor histidine kinase [Psychroflexus montanilacus]|uniref:sensor histidine kinase n=1 Tax=Psychroflexus montanilacus TaxID=2873598 RepID=UPI001CCCEC79|nr:sensor histidine kinase [Psychroflexus montanilacus]MBZ9651032.1 sensor histidine kinase [Psychroflexus montanilacus]